MIGGYESIDILTVAGGLQVCSQLFIENYWYDPYGDNLYRRSRAESTSSPLPLQEQWKESSRPSFGLAVAFPWAAGSNVSDRYHSPFRMMIEERVLEKNMFSLKLSQNESDEGYLIFGGHYNTTFEGDLVSHPIFPPHTKHWSVEASSLSMTTIDASGNPRTLLNESLIGCQAIFSTENAALYFPEPLFSQILAQLPVTQGICHERVVDCNRLDEFPVMIIGFGYQKISLTGRDYLQRVRGPPFCKRKGVTECVPAIQLRYTPNPNLNPPEHPRAETENYIVLGLTFMEKVYSVFNHDERTISRKLRG